MIKVKTRCPICDGVMEKTLLQRTISVGYGKANCTLFDYVCTTCGFKIGDEKENEKSMKKAIDEASENCALYILNDFKKQNIGFSDIERNFYLPYRTISKWHNKRKKPSASAVTLLRIIHAFPWLSKVGSIGFENEKAKYIASYYYVSEFIKSVIDLFALSRKNNYTISKSKSRNVLSYDTKKNDYFNFQKINRICYDYKI